MPRMCVLRSLPHCHGAGPRTNEYLTLVALSTTASALALLLLAISTKTPLSIPPGSALASVVGGLGLVCQLSGYYCLTYSLGATITSVFLLAVAPLTAIWASFFFQGTNDLAPVVRGRPHLGGGVAFCKRHQAK